MMKYLVGIDIGTTGAKTLVFNENGRRVGHAYRSYSVQNPKPDWVEQDPKVWWQALVSTVREAISALKDPEHVAALSISSQGGSLVTLDSDGNPLIPAISWMDRRAGQLELDALLNGKETNYHYTHTGWKLTNSFNLVQIKWLANHRTDIFMKAAHFLSTSDYINFRLTGKYVTDATSAGITNMEDIRLRDWDERAFADLGISRKQVARIRPSGEVIGCLTAEAADEMGLSMNTLVVNGGHDQYCGAIGSGAIQSGDLMLATGTAWVVLGTFRQMLFDNESYIAPCPHILPDKYGAMATVPTGGMSMEWFRKTFKSFGINDLESFAAIDDEAAAIAPGSEGLLFYPHFSGATCPSWNIQNRAAFLGIHLRHTRAHFARAVMEGVAYDVNEIIRSLERKGGKTKQILLIGGAAKSDLWSEIVANVTNLPVLRPRQTDAACMGAAMIAAVGARCVPDYNAAAERFCETPSAILPNDECIRTYEKAQERYLRGFSLLSKFYCEGED